MSKKNDKENNFVIEMKNVNKKYKKQNRDVFVLKDLDVKFELGKFYAIMGHSGAGKSTLINILGLIDTLDNGVYKLYGEDVSGLSDNKLSKLRMKDIGFIFQNFELDDDLNAIDNVMLPMYINKEIKKNEREKRAKLLLDEFGIINRNNHYPKELSGGEQQRVAIARAMANDPSIIVADEPTGNLDETKEKEIFEYLKNMTKLGKCVIVVSHSNEVKKYADKLYKLIDGKLVGEESEKK